MPARCRSMRSKGSIAPFDAAHPRSCAASPARSPSPRRIRDLLDGSEIVYQPPRLRPGAGPLQLPLPAAGDGRRARPAHQRRAHAGDRGQCGDRQSDPLPRTADEVISGGNFHAQPVAFAADIIAMALCEVGSISERRTSVLVDPQHEPPAGLPDRRRRGQFGADDPAGHRRRLGQREQEPRLSRPASIRSRPAPGRRTMSAWPRSPRARR